MTCVVVGAAVRARDRRRERVHDDVAPGCAPIVGDEGVDLGGPVQARAASVRHRSLREDHPPARCHVRVVGIEVVLGARQACLGPRLAGVVGLGEPRVATLRTVPAGVHVATVVADRQHRLVVPADLAVGRDGVGPSLAVVRGSDEHDVVSVHVQGVDGTRVGRDLDDRVELPRSLARAQRPLLAPGRAAVLGDRQRHPRASGSCRRTVWPRTGSRPRRRTARSGRRRSRAPNRRPLAFNTYSPDQPGAGSERQGAGLDAERAVPPAPARPASRRSCVSSACSAASAEPPWPSSPAGSVVPARPAPWWPVPLEGVAVRSAMSSRRRR